MTESLASLPPGYSTQEVWSFRGARGFSYAFSYVYGPPDLTDHRGPICHLDEGLSYWVILWQDGVHPAGRRVTYEEARQSHPGLTFRRFSSSLAMRDEIAQLLHVTDIALDADPAATPGWLPTLAPVST